METAKFSTEGLYTYRSFIKKVGCRNLAQTLADSGNNGWTKGTHAKYSSVRNALSDCREDLNVRLQFPFEEEETLQFIGWMLQKGLASVTISGYLAGVKALHKTAGLAEPDLRTSMVKDVLRGQKRADQIAKKAETKNEREPITRTMMMLMKHNLVKLPKKERLLIWAFCTLAWNASTRVHELLGKKTQTFDPTTTLTWADLRWDKVEVEGEQVETLEITIKHPKVMRGSGDDRIVVFSLDNFMCPVRAMKKFRASWGTEARDDMPVFRHATGRCLTARRLNSTLAELLVQMTTMGYGGKITSHSFRAGIVNEMTDEYSEEEIQGVGRWSSDAYLHYIKKPMAKRALIARRIGKGLKRL